MKKISLCWDSLHDRERLHALLEEGMVCLGSSDTIIGLLAPMSVGGIIALDTLKGRSKKPYIVLVGSLVQAEQFAYIPGGYIQELLKTYWPGPLTVVLRAKPFYKELVKNEEDTVAIRVPQHVALLQVLQTISGVFSTSANKAGKQVPITLGEVDSEILNKVCCTISDRNPRENIIPSTIIDCSGNDIVCIREGAIPFARIKAFLDDFKKK